VRACGYNRFRKIHTIRAKTASQTNMAEKKSEKAYKAGSQIQTQV